MVYATHTPCAYPPPTVRLPSPYRAPTCPLLRQLNVSAAFAFEIGEWSTARMPATRTPATRTPAAGSTTTTRTTALTPHVPRGTGGGTEPGIEPGTDSGTEAGIAPGALLPAPLPGPPPLPLQQAGGGRRQLQQTQPPRPPHEPHAPHVPHDPSDPRWCLRHFNPSSTEAYEQVCMHMHMHMHMHMPCHACSHAMPYTCTCKRHARAMHMPCIYSTV